MIEGSESVSLLDYSGTDRLQECHHTTLRHGNEPRYSHISHYELTEDAKDAILLDVRMVMSGSF